MTHDRQRPHDRDSDSLEPQHSTAPATVPRRADRAGAGISSSRIPARRAAAGAASAVQLKSVDLSADRRTAPSWQADYSDHWALVAGQVVQAKSAADPADLDPGTTQDLAATGVAGPGTALPHHAQIQQSFGHHDVSGIRAHVGGAAATAATAIGAEAYATGDAVAFRDTPDLHTAAHEAAHVVQQRAGVSLKGGVGEAGDAYEHHADAVADKVVAGESAVDLLGHVAPSGGGAHAVQKKGYRPEDKNEGRGIATLRSRQPTAKQSDPGYTPLPAWAGMTIQEFTPGNLLSHVTDLVLHTEIKPRSLTELSRGWKEHLEAGHSTKSVSQGNVVAEVTAGYKNATARGNNTYYADLTWRIALIKQNPDGAEGDSVAGEQAQIEEGGRIVFTTAGPVDIVTGPSARRPDGLALDPTASADRSKGRVTCGDADEEPDDQCFFSAKERERAWLAARGSISTALQNFVRACDQRKAAIKAALAADDAFVYALAEAALGFGLTAVIKFGAKKLVGAAAGKAPTIGSDLGPDAVMDWADRAGAHDHLTSGCSSETDAHARRFFGADLGVRSTMLART